MLTFPFTTTPLRSICYIHQSFIDPATGDYLLLPDSPAIDAGDPTTVTERRPDGDLTLRANIGAFEMLDLPDGPFQEVGGLVVMEAEHFAQHLQPGDRAWVTQNTIADYAGSGYLSALPDTDLQFTTAYTITSPNYTIRLTLPPPALTISGCGAMLQMGLATRFTWSWTIRLR